MAPTPNKDEFLYPQRPFRGEFTPENLLLDANLQEFAGRVGIICALENSGKITPLEAYEQIKDLWEKLEASRRNLFGKEGAD
ncbi:MAG: hypothetical protein RMK91_05190 [Pseudanabaenaceae cyanobacterium SKYGB_i_bin29]|nr:hypothetical protein [Pseudanabaenaceae cyanobacterium SKYG29]MDW8421242.1 hypothetical protein [Pseudanabaenaceae cyanobacterium SKYGB_i_bin29]